jgi:hypothetical protein
MSRIRVVDHKIGVRLRRARGCPDLTRYARELVGEDGLDGAVDPIDADPTCPSPMMVAATVFRRSRRFTPMCVKAIRGRWDGQ